MSRIDDVFRPVPRTGVIFVTTEAQKRGFAYGDPDWVNLGQGAPETGPLPGAAPRVTGFTLDERQHEYSPVAGVGELREAVAALYNARYRRGLPQQYCAENVAICSGGRLGLARAVTALGRIHLGHLIPDYTAYEELLEAFRSFTPLPVALRRDHGFRLTAPLFREAVLDLGLGGLLLSNPCNPTGQLIDGAELDDIVRTGRELGCAFIFDEFYSHYVYGGEEGATASVAAHVEDVDREPVVILDGLTKNWRYPGWRICWIVAPRAVIDRVSSAGSFLDGGAPHPVQRAAIPLVSADNAALEAAAIQRTFQQKRDLVAQRLRDIGFTLPTTPTGAFYCFAGLEDLPGGLRDGMDFFWAALEQKVITVPGEFFDVNPGRRRGHLPSRLKSFVRISYGPPQANLELGLDRLEALVREARG